MGRVAHAGVEAGVTAGWVRWRRRVWARGEGGVCVEHAPWMRGVDMREVGRGRAGWEHSAWAAAVHQRRTR